MRVGLPPIDMSGVNPLRTSQLLSFEDQHNDAAPALRSTGVRAWLNARADESSDPKRERFRHVMPFGPRPLIGAGSEGGFEFRLWAPSERHVRVQLLPRSGGHEREYVCGSHGGWHRAVVPMARPGDYYSFHLGSGLNVPDPASRYNPGGVNAPSLLVDPTDFTWDADWHGRPWRDSVIYEMHIGTFTAEGTFKAAKDRLDYLAGLGITAIQLMPVAASRGKRGWGYDGTLLYAPDRFYGSPDDLKNFIQAAHRRGLMVYLDVGYKHIGSEGNYLHTYVPEFFAPAQHTPWGPETAVEGDVRRVVREFFIHNAMYWLDEYRFDGLRLDAVHQIFDGSKPDFLNELATRVHQQAGTRHIHLMIENANSASCLGGAGVGGCFDAQWNDDFHRAAHVVLTGENHGYYGDYADVPIVRLARSLAEGFSYQGEHSEYAGASRGEPTDKLAATSFVNFLQNHHQVGNRAFGERIASLTTPEKLRAIVALQLLAPAPPMIFMGEEFGATNPFLYFCDPSPELADSIRQGRRLQFSGFFEADAMANPPDPCATKTFCTSKMDWQSLEQAQHQEWLTFYARLLSVRQSVILPALHSLPAGHARCTFLNESAFEIRWPPSGDELLIIQANLSDTAVHGFKVPSCLPAIAIGAPNTGPNELGPWSVRVYVDTAPGCSR